MRKVAIFTGTRAEYGLLYWVIKGLQAAREIELQLFVGGMHLSPEFGYTLKQIEADGIPVTEKLEFLLSSDTPVGMGKSMGLALISGVEVLARHQPDILVLLGDRFEALALAQAALVNSTPIAHIHGGEVTEGVMDDAMRHAITKMSHLHFTATEVYRNRVIQLGEAPASVFNVGAPGIDNIRKLQLLSREALAKELGLSLDSPYFVLTYHPLTLCDENNQADVVSRLCHILLAHKRHKLIITYPNADKNGREIICAIEALAQQYPERIHVVKSLGQLRYLSLLKHCVMVVGNSSSGLIEAPTFNIPTINIGSRQNGRVLSDSVISCGDDEQSIKLAVENGLTESFVQKCKEIKNKYEGENTSERIVSSLINFPLESIVQKNFYDIN